MCGWEQMHQRFGENGEHPASRKKCNLSFTLSNPSGSNSGILCLHVHARGAIVQTLHLMPEVRGSFFSDLLWSAAKQHCLNVLLGSGRSEFQFSVEETCARTLSAASFWVSKLGWEATPDVHSALKKAGDTGQPPKWRHGGDYALWYTLRLDRIPGQSDASASVGGGDCGSGSSGCPGGSNASGNCGHAPSTAPQQGQQSTREQPSSSNSSTRVHAHDACSSYAQLERPADVPDQWKRVVICSPDVPGKVAPIAWLTKFLIEHHKLLSGEGIFDDGCTFGSQITDASLKAALALVNFDNAALVRAHGNTGTYGEPAAGVQAHNASLLQFSTSPWPLETPIPAWPEDCCQAVREGYLREVFDCLSRKVVAQVGSSNDKISLSFGWAVGENSTVENVFLGSTESERDLRNAIVHCALAARDLTAAWQASDTNLLLDGTGKQLDLSKIKAVRTLAQSLAPCPSDKGHLMLVDIRPQKPFFSSPIMSHSCILFPMHGRDSSSHPESSVGAPWFGYTLTIYGHAPLLLKPGVGYFLPPNLFAVVDHIYPSSSQLDVSSMPALLLLLPDWPSSEFFSTCCSPPVCHGGLYTRCSGGAVARSDARVMHGSVGGVDGSDVCFRVMHGSSKSREVLPFLLKQIRLFDTSFLENLPDEVDMLTDWAREPDTDRPCIPGARSPVENSDLGSDIVLVVMYLQSGGVLGLMQGVKKNASEGERSGSVDCGDWAVVLREKQKATPGDESSWKRCGPDVALNLGLVFWNEVAARDKLASLLTDKYLTSGLPSSSNMGYCLPGAALYPQELRRDILLQQHGSMCEIYDQVVWELLHQSGKINFGCMAGGWPWAWESLKKEHVNFVRKVAGAFKDGIGALSIGISLPDGSCFVSSICSRCIKRSA